MVHDEHSAKSGCRALHTGHDVHVFAYLTVHAAHSVSVSESPLSELDGEPSRPRCCLRWRGGGFCGGLGARWGPTGVITMIGIGAGDWA